MICYNPSVDQFKNDYKNADVFLVINEDNTFEYKISGFDSNPEDTLVEGAWELNKDTITLLANDDNIITNKIGNGIIIEIENDFCRYAFEFVKID